jgi:hypothetical protein
MVRERGSAMTKRAQTLVVYAAVFAALTLLSACATPGPSLALLEDERCTRYGGLWLAGAGYCSHPSSTGR